MNAGDRVGMATHDTAQGVQVTLSDRTTGQSGSMTASAANGYAQIKYDPTGTSCQAIPCNFHPMYSTSSPQTRVIWAAHTYNVAFSDEIGHFEDCNGPNPESQTASAARRVGAGVVCGPGLRQRGGWTYPGLRSRLGNREQSPAATGAKSYQHRRQSCAGSRYLVP